MKSISLSIIALFAFCFCSVAQSFIIDGYTDRVSYRAGETVTFFLNAYVAWPFPCSLNPSNCCSLYPSSCQLNLHLFDMSGSLVATIPSVDIMSQRPQSNPWENGFGYTASAQTWTVPSTLKSGYYFIPSSFDLIPIIIKDANYPSTADIVVVCPTNTINAYTRSGGNSLYTGASTVSFMRPQSRINYGNYDDGFFRWIITSGMTNNYNVNFISDMDMDDYDEIANTKILIVPGHSEYWSRKARVNFDKYVNAGKDAMILSGNSLWWQVRYEDANYNSDNTKLTCYRDVNLDNMNNTDKLLVCIHWNEPTLKSSILGSIGADWLRGGIGVDAGSVSGAGNPIPCYDGFNGHRIILPQSPILSGLNFNFHELLPFATGEYDGTLVVTDANGNALDANGNLIDNSGGDPILDVSSLGFFRAELIGYDKITPPSSQQYTGSVDPNNPNITKYCPFMVFQKTCTSGTIINISSNEWCANWGIGYNETGEINPHGDSYCGSSSTLVPDSRIPQITANMINLLMQDQNSNTIGINNGDNLFFNPRTSGSFSMKPTYTNVSYNVCSTGSVDMTPCGVYITDGYKLDRGFTYNYGTEYDLNNNSADADIDATCTNYNNGLRQMKPSNQQEIKRNIIHTEQQPEIKIFPNPSNGIFIVVVQNVNQTNTMEIYNAMGEIINSFKPQTINEIDLSDKAKGIYFIKLLGTDNISCKRIIIQ